MNKKFSNGTNPSDHPIFYTEVFLKTIGHANSYGIEGNPISGKCPDGDYYGWYYAYCFEIDKGNPVGEFLNPTYHVRNGVRRSAKKTPKEHFVVYNNRLYKAIEESKKFSGLGDFGPMYALRSTGPEDEVNIKPIIDPEFKIDDKVIDKLVRPKFDSTYKSFSSEDQTSLIHPVEPKLTGSDHFTIKSYIDPKFGVKVTELKWILNDINPDYVLTRK